MRPQEINWEELRKTDKKAYVTFRRATQEPYADSTVSTIINELIESGYDTYVPVGATSGRLETEDGEQYYLHTFLQQDYAMLVLELITDKSREDLK